MYLHTMKPEHNARTHTHEHGLWTPGKGFFSNIFHMFDRLGRVAEKVLRYLESIYHAFVVRAHEHRNNKVACFSTSRSGNIIRLLKKVSYLILSTSV